MNHEAERTGKNTGPFKPIPGIDLANPDHLIDCTWQKFHTGVSWAPQRIVVNGRRGRRAICVIAEDEYHYRVYDLESPRHGIDEIEDSEKSGEQDMMS